MNDYETGNWTMPCPDNASLCMDTHSNSTTELPSKPKLLAQSPHMIVVFTLGYFFIFFLALVNNSLVITVIYRTPQMRTVTNMFLANLAVADILVSLVVLPFTLLNNLFIEWIFGAFLCKAVPYLQAVVVSASVNTLAAVAVERYFAIFYPHKTMIHARTALIIIGAIWLVPMGIQLPWALYYGLSTYYKKTVTICHLNFNSTNTEKGFFFGVVFLTCYIIPLLFISVFYSMIGLRVWRRNVSGIRGSKAERNIQRSKIRIVRMLVTVAMVFALLWLPLYSLRMRHYFGRQLKGDERVLVMRVLFPLAQWFSSANSCVNPFIYCYFSEQFRKYTFELVKEITGNSKCCQWKKRSTFALTDNGANHNRQSTRSTPKIAFTPLNNADHSTVTVMCDKSTLAKFPNDQSTLQDDNSMDALHLEGQSTPDKFVAAV